jgi:DNA-binding CsgD family transcriptional regulator
VIDLTPRQKQVMELLVQGKPYKVVGSILGIAEKTVGQHVEGAKNRLGVDTTGEAVAIFLKG